MSLPDSTIIVPGYIAPNTQSPRPEWDPAEPIPAKSSVMDYGYIIKDKAVGCTPQELIETFAQRKSEISFVWTPETPQPVRPEQVPFLVESFRRLEGKGARQYLVIGAILLVLGLIGSLSLADWNPMLRHLLLFSGATALAVGNWKFWRARNYTQDDAIGEASDDRFLIWVKKQSVSGYAITIIASIIVVTIVQAWAPDGVARVGLVKPAVLRGEFWRLFTASLMHQNFSYVYGEAVLFIHLSKVIEQAVQRAFVPLLFLVSAVVGNVFSVMLQPQTASVGAYGGVMGLLGFIVVAACLDRTRFPQTYFKRMLALAAILGAMGLIVSTYIDNAANLGGLLTGMTLGFLATKWQQAPITGKLLRLGSIAGVVGVVSTAVFALYRLITN